LREVGAQVTISEVAVYKDHLFAAKCRLEGLHDTSLSSSTLPPDLIRLYAYRQARIWTAAIGIAGFVLVLFDVLGGGRYSTHILLLAWLVMSIVYGATMTIARFHLRRVATRCARPTGDVFLDLARLESDAAVRDAVVRTHRLEQASFALPLAVLALLAPLSLHFIFSLVFLQVSLTSFGGWIAISLLIVGHAHITLLVLAVLHVARLRRELDAGQQVAGASRGFKALLWTTFASAIPGVFLLCIPPPMVFLTGLVFVPWAFAWTARRASSERGRLEELCAPASEPPAILGITDAAGQ